MADIFNKARRSQIMASIKGKHTAPERLIASILARLGFVPQLHRCDLPGSPDLVLARKKVAIFVNGCYWHGHDNCPRATLPSTNQAFWKEKINKNKRRDVRQRRQLRAMGWRVLTFWTCKPYNEHAVLSRLRRVSQIRGRK